MRGTSVADRDQFGHDKSAARALSREYGHVFFPIFGEVVDIEFHTLLRNAIASRCKTGIGRTAERDDNGNRVLKSLGAS